MDGPRFPLDPFGLYLFPCSYIGLAVQEVSERSRPVLPRWHRHTRHDDVRPGLGTVIRSVPTLSDASVVLISGHDMVWYCTLVQGTMSSNYRQFHSGCLSFNAIERNAACFESRDLTLVPFKARSIGDILRGALAVSWRMAYVAR